MTNNIDFSIIRERALRNIREDLMNDWSDKYDANQIANTFDGVVAAHREGAVIEDFVPVLVEAEMRDRLRDGELTS
ncbi:MULTISPECIES: three-helix bundle dimerization domain-containing protein [unclassified Corynebacterium]|uniref:three-helix bundle dimerization domain-containing protein n=1 Tax=unclassified Corynebacterium TaxID=2624378 RepID=UPI002A908F04|nr:hypothetical protein [Corynebacterium sp.]MDY5785638.1 hypothetical protein [Corynebacterium sp.]